MSAGSSSAGKVVLELTLDASPARRGFTQARADAIRASAQIRNDARIQLQVDINRLKGDFNQAQREAQTAKRLIEMQNRISLQMDLARLRSDLRTAEREHAASIRRMNQGSQLGAIGGAVLGGLGVGAGLGLVSQGVGAITGAFQQGVGVVVRYNAEIQSAEALIKGFTRSTFAVAEAQQLANQALDAGLGGYQETLTALSALTPLSRKYGESLSDVLRVTQLLAASDPLQGFEGAKIALQEALSGNYTSLQRRFELPASLFTSLKNQGLSDLQVVERALESIGLTQAVLTEQSKTLNQQWRIGADLVRRFLAEAGRPLVDFGGEALADFIAFMKSPGVQGAGANFAAGLRDDLDELRAWLGDEGNRQSLRNYAEDLGDLVEVVAGLGAAARPLADAGGLVLDVRDQFHALGDALIATEQRLGGTGRGVESLIATIKGPQGLIAAVKELNAVMTGPEANAWINKWLPGGGPGTGRNAIPVPGVTPGFPAPPPGQVPLWQQPGFLAANTNLPTGGTLPPRTSAVAPESERQYDILANARLGEEAARRYAAALADLRLAFASFDESDFQVFDRLRQSVGDAFGNLFGDLDLQQQMARGLGDLDTLTAQLVDDIRRYGAVSEETGQRVRAVLGAQADGVLALAAQYATLADATDRATTAADALEAAQGALTEAQRVASDNADRYRESVATLQRDLSDLSEQAADVARGYADRLAALRDERDAAQALAEAHRRGFEEQIAGLASVQAAKAKSEALDNLTSQQNATLLSFEQRIRAARRPGGAGEAAARALEEERDRFLARSRYAIQLAQLEATVAKDTADRESKTIQDQADAQAEKDQDAIDAIDARIAALEDEAENVARDYEARQRAMRDLIDAEEERARVVAAADRQAVADAQTRVTNAQTAQRLANEELVAAQKVVTELGNQNTLLQSRIDAQKQFIDYLHGLGIDVARYFNGGALPALPAPATPGGGSGGGNFEALRAPRPAGYAPPAPPAQYVGGWALRGGGGGASYSRQSSRNIVVNVSLPNATIRETTDVDVVMRRAADLAQSEILEALREDDRGGGTMTWREEW